MLQWVTLMPQWTLPEWILNVFAAIGPIVAAVIGIRAAQAAERSARATMHSVEEMKASRVEALRPRLIPFSESRRREGTYTRLHLTVKNVGNGDPVGTCFFFQDSADFDQGPVLGLEAYKYLEYDVPITVDLAPKVRFSGQKTICLGLSYKDVEGRHYATAYPNAKLSLQLPSEVNIDDLGEPEFRADGDKR